MMGRKPKTAEEKKAAYEKQKAKFREWYAKPENHEKKMAANAAYKDANRKKVNAQALQHQHMMKRITLVKPYRMEDSVCVWFVNRAEMNTWLRANDLKAYRNHMVKSDPMEMHTGIWAKAANEYYVSIFTSVKEKTCLHFFNPEK